MTTPSQPLVFDPQVNGYAGVDFQADNPSAERLRIATQGWRRDGGDQFLLTLVTDHWPVLLNRLRALRALVVGRPDLRDVIAGWHIEGPFLSDQPGYHGAHEPSLMLDPTPDHFGQLRDAVGSDPLLVTLAPERRGAIDAIAEARKLGITISLGHTNASASQIRDAAAAGATAFTHLGNACPQQLDRHDNILWRVVDVPDLTIGLIADGLHVSPLLFRLLHRVVSPDRIYYTTDAMAAAGAPPGDYPLGRLRLHVGPDRIVRQPGRSNFAGSALMPDEILPRASDMLGEPASGLLQAVTTNPRRWLGLSHNNRPAT